MTTTINDLQKFTLSVAEQTAAGAAIPIVEVPLWAGDNDAVATITVAPDALSVVVTSVAPGSMTVMCTVDGLIAYESVTVVAMPNVLVLTAQAPEPK